MRRYTNRLLKHMSEFDLALLEPHLTRVEFTRRKQMEYPGRKIESAYFPEGGVVSVVASLGEQDSEVGLIGCEGVTATAVILGCDRSPLSAYAQIPGHGYQIPIMPFIDAINASPGLHNLLLRYMQIYQLQVAYNSVTNARGSLEHRLARWLLMAHDRVAQDEIAITHEFLAMMMGCRRPGVTEAIHALARRNLIEGGRARITILDRKRLEEVAGKFYGVAEKEYRRLISDAPKSAIGLAPILA